MLIDSKLLLEYGATTEKFTPSEIIFSEDSTPKYYYQLVSGRVKLNHIDESGKEFIQTILTSGQSVCELMLFIDESYPVNAIALTNASALRIKKENFFKLLDDHHQISLDINKFLAERLYQKFLMLQNNSSLDPEVRIMGILRYLKSFNENKTPHTFEVLHTRQQLASLTGLRVETVIRTIKKMEEKKIVKIENRKILL
ncbi:Crp/Fnr family transcriptional regulator [Chryseobacterium wangxinyae]|uniref:Crp/Fnr family transcriptional regulator n=1 Tax=Chryseobacterium sp. CY353 TaxID=2997334 RepID=UPI00226D5C26|nr:Crp/Fnr family transcriptional regulator [Chryseobacterium sp. CY353]MCY0969314.1 Crp/Fnr family transcriptional regulator [Chryseobacterium sp. CY353]